MPRFMAGCWGRSVSIDASRRGETHERDLAEGAFDVGPVYTPFLLG